MKGVVLASQHFDGGSSIIEFPSAEAVVAPAAGLKPGPFENYEA
jgi:hypothetical protein